MAQGLLSPDDMMMQDEPYLLFNPEDVNRAGNRQAAKDFVRGASYAPFDLLGAPVDIANLALSPFGLSSENPFMGSNYLIDAYASIFPQNARSNTVDEMMGRIMGGVVFDAGTVATSLSKLNMKVDKEITAFKDSRKLRTQASKEKNPQKAEEAQQMASVLEAEASPLTAVVKRINNEGKEPQFITKDDGTYLTVRPSGLDRQSAERVVRGARERDADGTGQVETASPLTKKEIDVILSDKDLNQAYQVADRISKEVNGVPYDLNFIMREKGTDRIASLAKQAAIGRAFMLAAKGTPEYKSSVFSAYGQQYPSLMEAINAKNYDDLLEKSYTQLGKETQMQFDRLPVQTTYHGGDLDYVTSTGGTNSIAMLRDVMQNQNLNVFRGGEPHDFLNKIDPQTGLNMNEQFRAVHDYFGHGTRGSKFDAAGEEMAYGSHSQMFSPLARMAMAAETRGQNSLVNFSPLNVTLEKRIDELTSELSLAKSDEAKADIRKQISELQMQREYAPQTSVLLPPEMLETGYSGGIPDYLRAVNRPDEGTAMPEMSIFHASPKAGLLEIDPSFVGTRMTAENYGVPEATSIKSYNRPDRSYFFQDQYRVGDPATRGDVNVYQGTGTGVYDAIADPVGLVDLAKFRNRGVLDRNLFYKDFEQAIKDYGYSGYSAPFGSGRAVQMFNPTQVRGILNE